MLILTRRLGEAIMIGDEISVVALGANGNQVRIGVAAPRNVAVHREEIWRRIHEGTAESKCEVSETNRVPTVIKSRRKRPAS